MDWHFEHNEQGLQKLWQLKQLISLAQHDDYREHFSADIMDKLANEIDSLLHQEPFSNQLNFLKPLQITDIQQTHSLKDYLRQLFGPGKKEISLSKQRQALIARAEHAEASAFEALAETAEVGRQRDEALSRIKELEKTLKIQQKTEN